MPRYHARAYAAIALERKIAAHDQRLNQMIIALMKEENPTMKMLLKRDAKKIEATIQKMREKLLSPTEQEEQEEQEEDPVNPPPILSGAK